MSRLAAQLQTELSKIATTALTIDKCTFAFNPAAPDPQQVHLVVGDAGSGSTYEIDRAGDTNWSVAPDGSSATLGGPICDKAKAGAHGSLQFVFGCPDTFLH
jgi:hypothetical protein